jgi:adenylate cyclase
VPLSSDIEAVLGRHFPSGRDPAARDGGREEEVATLLRVVGLHPESDGAAERATAEAIEAAREAGVELETLVALAQAYSRGLGRVVAAESDYVRRLLKAHGAARRADYLDELLSTSLPRAHDLFVTLHQAMLRDALEDTLTDESLGEPEVTLRAVALVDVCDSTGYFADAGLGQTEQLVDALFEAGRSAAARRAVWVVKYVGDGVFLLGRRPRDVADAALHAIASLEAELPLGARAGLAAGPVVRRAGDYFGMAVNLAQRLAAAAQPGQLLATEPAAADLAGERVSARKQLEVRGVEEPVAVAVIDR